MVGLRFQAAKPSWTEKDLSNVVEKLSKAKAGPGWGIGMIWVLSGSAGAM